MPNNEIEQMLNAARRGDGKTAAEIGGKMKEGLSEEKKKMLERALSDGDYLKTLLSSDRARAIIENIKRKGNE